MKKLNLNIILSLILSGFFFFSKNTFAQQYNFINYSSDQGLAQSQVTSIVQDKKGYLWFTTFGGVSKFDGKKFKNYSKENGLINNQLFTEFIDSKNRIWFGGLGGFSFYENGKFTSIKLKKELNNLNVVSICEDKEGAFWIAIERAGVARYFNNQITYYVHNEIPNNVRWVECDQQGKIWVATRNGLFYLDKNEFINHPILNDGDKNISFITEDKKGNKWVGTFDEGIYIISKNKTENLTAEEGLISNWIRHIFIDADGSAWCSAKNGVSKINDQKIKNFSASQGLINPNINVVGQDKEGNIWFCTDGKGVLRFSGEAFTNYTTLDGLPSDFVMSTTEAWDNQLWFTTYGKGIASFDGTNFTTYDEEDGLTNNTVWSSAFDGKYLWLGTSFGLSRFDGKTFYNYYEEDGLISNKITFLLHDKNKLWIGAQDGLSLYENEKFTNFSDNQGLTGVNIRSIFKDKNGKLWLGTSSGIFIYHKNEFKNILHDSPENDNTIYCIQEDKKGTIWIGTKNGLYYYNETEEKFKKVIFTENVNAQIVNFLIVENDILWIGTNNSIYTLNTTRLLEEGFVESKHYTKLEGIRGDETNLNAAYKDQSGSFWFGTDGGLVQFNPEKRKKNKNEVEAFIHIESIKLFLEEVDWKKYTNEIDTETKLPLSLSVPYNKNHFTFEFQGICLSNPNKVKYQFMLEGFDPDWSPITEITNITYSNLPPGTYSFKVRASNDEGVWNNQAAVFTFTITSPFWLTWWFFLLCSLVVLLIIVGSYRWRLAVIHRRNKTQQLEYKSRLLALEQQSLNASMNRHFIFNALNSIQYYINKQERLEANKYLTSFAKLIRKNLDSSVSGDLVSLAEELERLELYLSLELMRFKGKFEYEIVIDDNVETEIVGIPPMLLQPYVENSIWHGILPMDNPGKITINIKLIDKNLFIQIVDDGIGISTSMKNKEKSSHGHVSRGIQINSGRLELLKQLTNENLKIEGPIETFDESGNVTGTVVNLTIPQVRPLKSSNLMENSSI